MAHHDLNEILPSHVTYSQQPFASARPKFGLRQGGSSELLGSSRRRSCCTHLKVLADQAEELNRLADRVEEDLVLGREGGIAHDLLGDLLDEGMIRSKGLANLRAPHGSRLFPCGTGEGPRGEEGPDGGEERLRGGRSARWTGREGMLEGSGLEHGEAGGGDEGV